MIVTDMNNMLEGITSKFNIGDTVFYVSGEQSRSYDGSQKVVAIGLDTSNKNVSSYKLEDGGWYFVNELSTQDKTKSIRKDITLSEFVDGYLTAYLNLQQKAERTLETKGAEELATDKSVILGVNPDR